MIIRYEPEPHIGPTGTWRYTVIRDGLKRWGSLKTKDRKVAQFRLDLKIEAARLNRERAA